MSYQAVESVMKFSQTKDVERLILMVIATHADEDDFVAFAGHALIAQEVNVAERTLIRHLKNLEKTPELVISRGNGKGRLTTYQINLPKVPKGDTYCHPLDTGKAATKGDKLALKDDNTSHPLMPERVTVETQRVTKDDERVTNEHPKGDKPTDAYIDIEPLGTIGTKEEKHPGADAPIVREIFEYWQSATSHPKAHYTDDRKAKIRARLKHYSAEDIKRAIDAVANSAFHRENGHDDLMLICRSDSQLEKYINLAEKKAPAKTVPKIVCPVCKGREWRIRRPDDDPGPYRAVPCECSRKPAPVTSGGRDERAEAASYAGH